MMSYAEDEADVDGTVNGVTNTASGEWGEPLPLTLPLPWGLLWECRVLPEHPWGAR